MGEALQKGYPCTFYIRPNGRAIVEPIRNMHKSDFDWFSKARAKLSGEQWEGTYTFYADVGVTLDDGVTPFEAIVTVTGEFDPFETFRKLRLSAEKIQQREATT